MIKLAIVIATYQRPDGNTPFYLNRVLMSISKQTLNNYWIYVIGDAYGDESELMFIVNKYPKTTCYNLDISPERERYGFGNMMIWCAGGVTAVNHGIDMALNDGYEYICHQAHDDTWEDNHLSSINGVIEDKSPFFVCTLSTYGKAILPPFPEKHVVLDYYPVDGGMIASSSCVKYSETNIRPVDRLHAEGIMSPCDAYLWECLRNEMKATGKMGYVKTTITCHHDEEGYAMNSNQIKRHEKLTNNNNRKIQPRRCMGRR